jgi:thymidine kinase
MPKLYFRYGTVGSAKTLNLLAVAHNYRQQDKRVLLIKPEIDTRFGLSLIKTRAGLEAEADILAPEVGKINFPRLDNVVCILVDEAQFLDPVAIEQFHSIAHHASPNVGRGIPVICYGLRTDFRSQLFPAAKRLMELADSIEEIKNVCTFCLHKATFNLKMRDGQPIFSGPPIELGCEELYLPVCGTCYVLRRTGQPATPIPQVNG